MYALREGFRRVRRSWGLVAVLLVVNVALAAVLAVPLARTLEKDLAKTEAARGMLYGFDYGWWSQWADAQSGWTSTFAPDIFGHGFAFRNVDLLLKGTLPAALFTVESDEGEGGREPLVDRMILGFGILYLLVQTFLAGGLLGVLRGEQGTWTVRGLLHGSGFYCGRFLRLAVLALLTDFVVFRLNVPITKWAEHHAHEAVAETTAMAWLLGRHALLLLALLFVNMISGYAKVIVVVEERSSAILAFLSSLAFCFRNVLRTFGHYLAVAGLGLLLLVLWNALDSRWEVSGYKTQIVSLLLAQALVFGRLGLRLMLMGGQIALYRKLTT